MSEGVQRELGRMTAEIKSLTDLNEKQSKILEQISAKLDYTNGKVKNHEFWIKAVKWGAGIICTTAILFTPTIINFLSDRIVSDVEKAVDESIEKKIKFILSTYEFTEQ